MRNPITIIQGGQFGSESKGTIAGYLAGVERPDFAVRTGATNAGHVVYYQDTKITMQQLPCGWVNPSTALIIGAGALVDLDILARELDAITLATGKSARSRVYVDPRAYIHRREHAERSHESGRHHAIGATGKGCSEALIDRVRGRGEGENWTIGNHRTDKRLHGVNIADTERMLNEGVDKGARIHLEGTQGQLLDLALGPYPFTTHKQTGPAQWMVEAGLSPSLPVRVVLVVRTMPIRVAGNSGPLPRETSWVIVARDINRTRDVHGLSPIVQDWALQEFEAALQTTAQQFSMPEGLNMAWKQHLWTPHQRSTYRKAISELNAVALAGLPEATRAELTKLFEMTTVTKKLRRIAHLDLPTLRISARQARPAEVAVTFLNYEFPEHWCESYPLEHGERSYLASIADTCNAPVTLVNRGPLPQHVIGCNVEP